jgi:hypothetical protein
MGCIERFQEWTPSGSPVFQLKPDYVSEHFVE